VLRFAAAVVLLMAALWWAGPVQVWGAARGADWRWIGASVLLVLLDRALMAYRWLTLLRPVLRPPVPSTQSIIRVFFVTGYLGFFLPGIGGDAVRTYALNRLAVPVADAFASVFVDRLLSIIATVVLAIAGVFVARELLQDRAIVAGLAAMIVICSGGAALVFSPSIGKFSLAVARRLRWSPLERIAEGAVAGVSQYAAHHGTLAFVFAGSVVVQVLRVLQAVCLGFALALTVPVGIYFAFIPVILLVIVLPISVNGIGTGQVAFVALFTRAGVSAADAFTLSVLYAALGLVGSLPGGLLYLFEPKERRAA
jgi:uncharacterized protein (TIRG00374 family)